MSRARNSVSGLKLNMENYENSDEKPQYNVFEDYLGLIKVVFPSFNFSNGHSSNYELTNEFSTEATIHRRRIDSLDSDGLSDSSSSGDREMDSLDGNDRFTYQRNPSPPVTAILETPSYSQTLETFIAAQKNAVNRMHAIVKDNRHFKNNSSNNKVTVCVFCRNNGESREFYSSHTLKDSEGNTSCPILRAYTCPLCKANGDNSHTIKYCSKYTPKLKEEKLLGNGLLL